MIWDYEELNRKVDKVYLGLEGGGFFSKLFFVFYYFWFIEFDFCYL